MSCDHPGGCLCGAVRYMIEGDTHHSTGHCHCTLCRGTTGAAVVTWTTVPRAAFRYTRGEPKEYRSSDKGTRWFCPDCGSQLAFRHDDYPDDVDVTVFSLDKPDKLPPEKHIWTGQRVSWLRIDEHLPQCSEGGV